MVQFALGYFNAGDFINESNRCEYSTSACDEDTNLEDSYEDSAIQTSDAWRIYANILLRF